MGTHSLRRTVKEPAGVWAGRRRKRYGDFNVAAVKIGPVSRGRERCVRRADMASWLPIAIFLRTVSSFAASIWPVSRRLTKRLRGQMMTGIDERDCRCGRMLLFMSV